VRPWEEQAQICLHCRQGIVFDPNSLNWVTMKGEQKLFCQLAEGAHLHKPDLVKAAAKARYVERVSEEVTKLPYNVPML
jgi:hypothetical protein